MKSRGKTSVLVAVLLLAGFGGMASLAFAQGGTNLSISFSEASIVCGANGASVTFYYTITSAGSAAAAEVVESISGTQVNTYTIANGNVNDGGGWTFAGGGPLKTYSSQYQASLANGTYTFEVCAYQPGAAHNDKKWTCNSQTVVINCGGDPDPSACADTAPFGEVPHNANLCSASGKIEVQFRGDFGTVANLAIAGPGGFTYNSAVNRAGDSCNYHYNWNPRPAGSTSNPGTGNGGAGSYTFTATGNYQNPLVWQADLVGNCGGTQ